MKKTTLCMASTLGLSIAGCGAAQISPQLRDARIAMEEAQRSSAARLEPDELLVAQRTLERAEAEEDGSPIEADMAYIAERQTRMAMANARRTELEQSVEQRQSQYRQGLEQLARSRGQQLQQTSQALTEAERARQAEAQARQAAEAARLEAEQRANDAMARLRELASVRQEARETVITLSGEVLFPSDQAELRPEARERLLAVADALRASAGQNVTIEGHTDSRGSDTYNRDLSQRRANAVRMYLIGEGVPADRIQALGQGESEPIASNDTPEGRANNRRVEIIIRPSTTTTTTTTTTTR